ncbi:hypothetical protein BDB00DRAFT_752901 [Zychaea mexicana]|uniref:uncharacterized protein n=1 Tax=Zychaea mexicana TaxID=64656 RepID=UPI0022FE98CB|nr:uncharacterized protein BDB00DRAFT_752901 [Zychaea mexicana]KAI9499488.1 hypothetical protein BDB00DRAFT_752901 [Zychaea mexicana]
MIEFIVKGFDVSNAFYDFQCAVNLRIAKGNLLMFESHVQHVLALSSIFLIKPRGCYCSYSSR